LLFEQARLASLQYIRNINPEEEILLKKIKSKLSKYKNKISNIKLNI